MNNEPKQVIVIRKDLKMNKGKLAAQACHASMAIFFNRGNIEEENDLGDGTYTIKNMLVIPLTEEMVTWVSGKFTKVCLRVDSEEELHKIYNDAKKSGLPCSIIKDEGLTVFKEPTYTCIGIGPASSDKIDKVTGHLSLY